MKNPADSQPEARPASSSEPVRRSFLIVIGLVGLAVISIALVVSTHRRLNSKVHSTSSAPDAGFVANSAAPAGDIALGRVPSKLAPPAEATLPELEPAEKAAHLVKTLSEVSLQLTPEKADQWKRNLEQLIEQGRAAIPALEDFLERNEDLRFDSAPGANLLGEPTLRIAFLKVLFDIPAPDNVQLEERVLQTTKDPAEIALLARQLELQEPGDYRRLIIQTASGTLQMAKNGELPGRDASPLVKLLEGYGIASVK